MKKQLLTAALAGLLSVGTIMTAFASAGGAVPSSDGTDVFAGIILNDPDAKINVKVPTLFAFVVNGSVTTDTAAVTVANGNVMLPNLKVKVNDHNVNNGDYQIEAVGGNQLKFENCSTAATTATEAATLGSRKGIPVTITGNIKNEGTSASRNYWEHISNATALEGDTDGFKKFTLSVNGINFSQAENGGYSMTSGIALAAPDLGYDSGTTTYSNLNSTTKYANTGAILETNFSVAVGGQRDQYNQVEESAKVGSIIWTIGYTIANTGVETSPSNPALN